MDSGSTLPIDSWITANQLPTLNYRSSATSALNFHLKIEPDELKIAMTKYKAIRTSIHQKRPIGTIIWKCLGTYHSCPNQGLHDI